MNVLEKYNLYLNDGAEQFKIESLEEFERHVKLELKDFPGKEELNLKPTMNLRELLKKLENKYSQEYVVEIYFDGLGRENIRIKNEFFEIIIPEYATSKKDFMIKTYDNLASYTIIESIANAVNRLLKK